MPSSTTDLEMLLQRPDIQAVPLRRDARTLLEGLPSLGVIASITMNDCVSCTRWGPVEKVRPMRGGTVLHDGPTGLRWMEDTWRFSVATLPREQPRQAPNLLLFGGHGELSHRIIVLDEGAGEAFRSLIEKHLGCAHCLRHEPAAERPDLEGPCPGAFLQEAWRDSSSPSDLAQRLSGLGLDRHQAVMALEGLYTSPVQVSNFAILLERIAAWGLPARFTVGNDHCLQTVECSLMDADLTCETWTLRGRNLNIRLDPGILDSIWSVARPGWEGERWQLECYDARGVQVLTLACPRNQCPITRMGWETLTKELELGWG